MTPLIVKLDTTPIISSLTHIFKGLHIVFFLLDFPAVFALPLLSFPPLSNLYVPTILQMSFAAPITSTLFSRLFRSSSTSAFSRPSDSQSRKMSGTTQKATVAAGCFWGVEHLFRKHFGSGKGLLDAKVGYSGGQISSPSYRAVCSGSTGRKSARNPARNPESRLAQVFMV